MRRTLLISIRFHEGRYHGAGDWPPAPARVFQALVAGAARGRTLENQDRAALCWLETLNPPVIAAPATRAGQEFRNYVPNNDLDAVSGDPRRVGEIRTPKLIRPRLFDPADSFLYVWNFDPGQAAESHARTLSAMAEKLYQLGRGVDMAWGWAEIFEATEIEPQLARYRGAVYRPAEGGTGAALPCSQPGSLKSLEDRFRANRYRFSPAGTKGEQLFSQPPKPRFRAVPYNSPPVRQLYDLRATGGGGAEPDFAPWPLPEAVALVTIIRDGAVARLKKGSPGRETLIERVLIGRDATEADKGARVRIVPVPSVGHAHADHAIRRVLIEIPPNCPITADDLEWSFSGLGLGVDHQTGEVISEVPAVLIPAGDDGMLDHYGIDRPARVWRTVTPAALPPTVARRRVDPFRLRGPGELKGAPERGEEQIRAAGAVAQALRHAGVGAGVATIRVQREPFIGKGERAEFFAPNTRFAKERLWHAEISFAEPVSGPLIVGDGRYLGLGLMEPVSDGWRDVIVFSVPPASHIAIAGSAPLLRAVRRALMSLSRDRVGNVPRLFSGHEVDGRAASSGQHEHVFLGSADVDGDGLVDQLIVAAPWACDRSIQGQRQDQARFDRIVSSLGAVRAGKLGVVKLGSPIEPGPGDGLIGPATVWKSCTPYRPTRHAGRRNDLAIAVSEDVIAECGRRGLPRPEIELLRLAGGPNGGDVSVTVRLRFGVVVRGPILLGRDSHSGGGLFWAQFPGSER